MNALRSPKSLSEPKRSTASYKRRFAPLLCSVSLALGSVGFGTPAFGASKAVKSGGACTKTQVGKQSGTLTCTKMGKLFRWNPTAGAPATSVLPASSQASSSVAGSSSAPFDLAQAINGAVKPAGFTFTSTLCEAQTGDCFGNLLSGNDRAELSIAGMSQAQWELNQTLGLTKSQKPGPVLYANINNGQLFLPMSNPNGVYAAYTLSLTGFGLTVPDGVPQMAEIIRPIASVLESISKR